MPAAAWTRFDRIEDPRSSDLMRLNYLGSGIRLCTLPHLAQPRPYRRGLEHGRADRRA
jgi:hypothetical protein